MRLLPLELVLNASVSNSTASTYSQTSSGIIVCTIIGIEPIRAVTTSSRSQYAPLPNSEHMSDILSLTEVVALDYSVLQKVATLLYSFAIKPQN